MRLELDVKLDRGGFALDVQATLDAPVTGLFGPSGAGKTTLLNAIAGLERRAEGRIVLNGRVLMDSRRRVFLAPHKRRVGVAFQDNRLFPHLSVRGNLAFGEGRTPPARRRLALAEVAELLDIGPLLERRIAGLSGGEQRRVALGRALLTSPDLLLLDEPLASLDVTLRHQILPLLRRVRDANICPILMVSHDLAEILELTDRMLILQSGGLVGCGAFLSLAEQPRALALMHNLGLLNLLKMHVIRHDPRQGYTLCHLAAAPAEGSGPAGSDPFSRLGEKVSDPISGAGPDGAPAGGGESATLRIPLLDVPEGSEVHAVLGADEIAISRAPVPAISMQNQLPGTIRRVIRAPQRALCLIDVGTDLLVELTFHAIEELRLAEGQQAWSLFKTHSLRILPTTAYNCRANRMSL